MAEQQYPFVALAEIVRDERWYPRAGLPPGVVAELAVFYREGGPAALPPIRVGRVPGVAGFWLIDGWRRVAAAEAEKLDSLPALGETYADEWEAFAHTVRIANTSPAALTNTERARSIDAFLLQFPQATDRELAPRLGISHVAVWKRRRKLLQRPRVVDPVAVSARALWKAWNDHRMACAAAADPATPEWLATMAQALADAAFRRSGEEAGEGLEQLEELAAEAWRRVAAEPPRAPAGRRSDRQ